MEHIRREKIWALREAAMPQQEKIDEMVRETGLSAIAVRLLISRGLQDAAAVSRFLQCEDTSFHSPFLMKDMEKAVARIRRAIDTGEKLVIYGDYDVDGVTSVSLLYLYLKSKGADVSYYIPGRDKEGYGVSINAVRDLAEQGVGCILTVDTGITANAEVAFAASLGVDMVVTDHHECREPLPEAVAVVNPHRADCSYPFKELAGVGVAFKLAGAIEASICMDNGGREIDGIRTVCRDFADLVAIGTIADVMPIVDENRLIVRLGISRISGDCRPGLAALIEEAGRVPGSSQPPKRKKITSSFIGFGIAPRLNAAGRMSDATIAVRLLLSRTKEEAARIAIELCEINRERQAEENRIAEQVYRRIENDFDPETTRVLVLEDDAWRQGIIGIVASRVTERYGLPSILISFDGATRGFASPDDRGKGSGRSVKGMNLVKALVHCEELLVKQGGHELAAGLTITRGNIEAFRERINAYAAQFLPSGGVQVQLDADLEIALSDASVTLVNELSSFEPFGVANPSPQFIIRDLAIDRITDLGGGKHLKLNVSDDQGATLCALCFSTSRSTFGMQEGDRVDLLCGIDINDFKGVRTVQLIVQDYKPSLSHLERCAEWEKTYRALRAGAPLRDCAMLPEYEDFAQVYKFLRKEFRLGNDTFAFPTLLTRVNGGLPKKIHYVALRYILEIFHELRICGVEEQEGLVFRFDIFFNASKTSIDKSAILKKLRSQYRQGE